MVRALWMLPLGCQRVSGSPPDADKLVARVVGQWGKAVKFSGAHAD
jgi:hypothetical protein